MKSQARKPLATKPGRRAAAAPTETAQAWRARPYRAGIPPCKSGPSRGLVFISPATTHLLVVLAKLEAALSSLVRIADYIAVTNTVAVWSVAVTHLTGAIFDRDLITRGRWPHCRRGMAACGEGTT